MSNALTDVRVELKELLEADGHRVSPEVPQTFTPPLCWIAPRDPYRQAGQTFGRKKVFVSIVCLAAAGTNAEALEKTDEMASEVADLVDTLDGYRLDPAQEIGVPKLYTSAQGQEFLGAPVNVIAEVARA
jgi:hypothetical protein